MKKKLLFKKVTALLCCIAMCVTTFMPTIYAATIEDDITVSMKVPDGMEFYHTNGITKLIETSDPITIGAKSNPKYRYVYEDGVITFFGPKDGVPFAAGDSISFCANTPVKPEVKSTNSVLFGVSIDDEPFEVDDLKLWVITVTFTRFAEEGTGSIIITPGVEKCNVTFQCGNYNGNGCYVWVNSSLISGNSYSYEKGKPASFSVELGDPESTQCTVRLVGGDVITAVGGVYTINNIQKDERVNITVGPKQFKVTTDLPAEADRKFNYYTTAKTTVDYEGEFWFELTPVAGYNEPKVTVTGAEYSKSPSSNRYTVFDIKDNVTVKVENGAPIGYTVSAQPSDEYILNVEGTNSFEYGFKATFTVEAKDGYVISSVKAKTEGAADSTEIKPVGGKYSVEVLGNVAITVETKYAVKYVFENQEAFTLTKGAASATDDAYYSFGVTTKPGYEAVKVYVNDEELTSTTGTYSFTVSGRPIIRIEGGAKIGYAVTLPKANANEYEVEFVDGTTPFYYGKAAKIRVTPNAAYDIDSVTATVGGAEIDVTDNKDGTYSFVVIGRTTVNVNASKKSYTVTIKTDNGNNNEYTVTAPQRTFEHGEVYTFTVAPEDGFKAPTVTFPAGTQYTKSGNQYSVVVTSAIEIDIKKAGNLTYTVTLNKNNEEFTYVDIPVTPVEHNGEFTFKVKVNDAYSKSTPRVDVNNIVINGTDDGNGIYTYTVTGVTANQVVTVSGLQKNTYNVTLGSSDAYSLTTTGLTRVSHGDNFKFKVVIADGYNKTGFTVKTDNDLEVSEPDEYGYYTVTVTGDTTITVEGLEAIIYTVDTSSVKNALVDAITTEISYGAPYSFMVNANDGYRLVNVSVNGLVVTPVNGKYTVTVTSDLTIEVETAENALTINYVCNEKNHELIGLTTSTLKYNEIDADAIAAHVSTCLIHEFDGWYNGTEKADVDYLKSLINTENATVTLIAQFKERPADAIAKALVELADTQRVFDVGAADGNKSVRVTFRTRADAKWDACVGDYVKVTAHGTLLLNVPVNFNTSDEVVAKLKYAGATPNGLQQLGVKIEGKNVHYCRTECNMSLGEVDGQEIILRASAKNPATYFAAGWLELTVGENVKVIIVSATNDAPAANAD